MTKSEYLIQVAKAQKRIDDLKAEDSGLANEYNRLNPDQTAEAKRIRLQREEIHGRISDQEYLKQVAEAQIAKWNEGMAQAAPLIKEASAVHEHARGIYGEFARLQGQVAALAKDLENDNNSLGGISSKFEELTGERLNIFPIVCHAAAAFVSAVGPINPDAYPPWTFVSEEERNKEYQELKARQLRQHEARLKVAEAHAPLCSDCKTTMIVNRRNGREDTPGESIHRGHWDFVCPKCGRISNVFIAETK
jgi:hypothetical protein